MSNVNKLAMNINDEVVNVTKIDGQDYICLTDMAKSAGAERALHSWLRSRNTISFLGLWEQTHNKSFNLHEFVQIKNRTGENSFNPSVKEWVTSTNAVGVFSKTGRYGGTYAHKDIAFEFGTWLSPEFKLLILTEFQRLKEQEVHAVEWDSRRFLSKVNYRLHTDAIKDHIIPSLSAGVILKYTYTNEADMINRLVFGFTAAEWKRDNAVPSLGQNNQRDYATTQQLVILANIESLNSYLISENISHTSRVKTLAKESQRQYMALLQRDELENDMRKGTGL